MIIYQYIILFRTWYWRGLIMMIFCHDNIMESSTFSNPSTNQKDCLSCAFTKINAYLNLDLEKMSLLLLIHTWPSGKLPFECQKNCQRLDILKKKLPKIFIFSKKLPMAMKIFGNFFEKNVKFLAIFWQSNGNFPKGQIHTTSR